MGTAPPANILNHRMFLLEPGRRSYAAPLRNLLMSSLRFKDMPGDYARNLSQQAEDFTRDLIVSQRMVDACICRLVDPFSNSLLPIQSPAKVNGQLAEVPSDGSIPSNCALLLHCVARDEVHIWAWCNPHVIHREQAHRILNQPAYILHQFMDPHMRVGDINLLSPENREDFANWNCGSGSPEACIHTTISHHAQTRPDAPAVHAHDGDFT
ncbi:hypothetical protein B0J12DRAFT_705871 [Macrophomina phaseolina]|uniref:Uncharacterized protein n=1 Tax=Macrophomina phaseolina TaxID=35725 RepID=A0ABQ8FTI7_9PEZI|nr:hypothetical protein B0J12DRAFT_705871 [Macrophomina phaseolina]